VIALSLVFSSAPAEAEILYFPTNITFESAHSADLWWGPWANVTDRYLGFRAKGRDGLPHYGWVRLDVSLQLTADHDLIHPTVTGYALNLTANEPILAGQTEGELSSLIPEPGTLTLLAVGAVCAGLLRWRRKPE
jgi:hypothetical protein